MRQLCLPELKPSTSVGLTLIEKNVKYSTYIGYFCVCQQHKLNLSAMFNDLEWFYFGTANYNSGVGLNRNVGVSLFKHKSRGKYEFSITNLIGLRDRAR